MWKQPAIWLLFVAFYTLFSAAPASADIKQLVMPGRVIEAHAGFEQQCRRCHQPFKKRAQGQLCLDCHKSLAEDLRQKKGFHGHSSAVAAADCKHCHTEHKGRTADVVLLDRETFDHRLTDFNLEGVHLRVACDACHTPEKRENAGPPDYAASSGFFSRAAADCYGCHNKAEPHQKRLGKKCQNCHRATSWDKISYSHDKSDFRLNAMHKPVSCVLCHPNQRWKKIADDCYSCHRLNDSHGGRYGKKCQDCHSDKGPAIDPKNPRSAWKKVKFDHRKTKFALEGKHLKLACNLCHPQQLYGQKLKTDCLSCHRHDDRHKGFYGPKCVQCHNTKGWKLSAFDHQKTSFPLRAKHQQVTCRSCHTRPTSAEKLGSRCINCHQLKDVHRNQESRRCERCHTPVGWREGVQFDHDLSRFPLIGLHAVVPCESCHQNVEFRQVRMKCDDCHQRDDKHKRRLGPDCEACHTPNGWTLWQFDHIGKKSFKLDGAHRDLECLACHKKPVKKKIRLARDCASCHRDQDIHQGAFGRNCERCHLSESFRKLRSSR